jgi:hypothetical protein
MVRIYSGRDKLIQKYGNEDSENDSIDSEVEI